MRATSTRSARSSANRADVRPVTRVGRVVSTDTTSSDPDLPLGGEFPTRSFAEWRSEVDKVLGRGAAELTPEQLADRFRRELVTETVDGLVIQPLYTDLGAAPEPGVAGSAPYTRGADVLAHRRYGWDVRQRVVATTDAAETHRRVLDELERGATSILLDLSGVDRVDTAYLDSILTDVHLDVAAV